LETFAKVTNFAKDKTTQALEHPLARPILPLIPENVRSHFLSSAEAEALLADYDSAQHFLAQIAQEWEHRIQSTVGKGEIEKTDYRNDVLYDYENFEKRHNAHFVGTPLTHETWNSFFNENGQFIPSPLEVKCHVFCGVNFIDVGN
jgi:hypothetical protein